MPPEFYSQYNRPTVKTITSPFIQDESQRLPLIESEQQMQQAGLKLKKLWETYLEGGITMCVQYAHITGKPQHLEIEIPGESTTDYIVSYLGDKTDGFGQELEAFRLVKTSQNQPQMASTITVATLADPKTRFENLASFIIEDEELSITKHQFHFVNNLLYAINQVSQPQVLFPTPYDNGGKQFLSVGIGETPDGVALLRVFAGFYHGEHNEHWYKNFGGNLVETRNVRANNGEVELIDILDGKIYSTPPLYLPKAIAKMANFEPATA